MVTKRRATVRKLGVVAYAKHRGVSHVAVLKAIKEGRITRDAAGKVDVARADKAWTTNTRPKSAAPASNGNGKAPARGTLTDARLDHETVKAQLKHLEYEKALGNLLDANEVHRKWFDRTRIVRDRALGLPDRTADALSIELDCDPIKLHKALTRELRAVLNAMADDLDALAAAEELERREPEAQDR